MVYKQNDSYFHPMMFRTSVRFTNGNNYRLNCTI